MTDTPPRVHALAAWYREVARDLPWRKDADPWSILVSEVVLQQTQVSRGIEHHRRVMERFPDLATMARAEVDDVLEVWAGAGYYARGRRLHALAREVLAEHEGVLPHSASTSSACQASARTLRRAGSRASHMVNRWQSWMGTFDE